MNNKEKNFVSAVVYVHNAKDRIEVFLTSVINILQDNFENSEIICVNDFSSDNSVEIIKKTCDDVKNISVSVINMSRFHGLESAMKAGVDLSIGDYVYEFDSTIQDYDDSEILNIYNKSLEGYDIVSAVPDKRYKQSSRLFYFVMERFQQAGHKLNTESFRILSRRVINRISETNTTVPYRKEVYATCGLKSTYVTYSVKVIKNRKSDRLERKYRKGLAVDTLILFTEVGYRFSVTMTFLMMVVAITMGLYSVVVYLASNPVDGWTTTILFIAFAFFGLFGILTVIIKYLQIIVNLVFRCKQYTFESVEKIS